MPIIDKYRIRALFCAVAVLLCELIARPFAEMGIGDDGPYVLMAKTLAATGHIAYNGGEAAMVLFQQYLGVAFIKLFGFSFTSARMSTLFVAMVLAFLLQRTLVRFGITERNATIGTLSLVLSPLFLLLSVTFMSDISGLFAIVLCLYSCLRALQASTDRYAIGWLCFAVVTNIICGTSRQVAWLGILLMVPATIWLLRSRPRVVASGVLATVAGTISILACIHWLSRQPYNIPVPLFASNFPVLHIAAQFLSLLLDLPFLLLPIFLAFLPELRKCRPRRILLLSAATLVYLLLAIHSHSATRMLEPTSGDSGGWIGTHGVCDAIGIRGGLPRFLPLPLQVLLTVACLGALAGLFASLLRKRRNLSAPAPPISPSWKQLALLFAPFPFVYAMTLIGLAGTTHTLYDRYALGLLIAALPCLIRFYQEQISFRLPAVTILLIPVMAFYGIVETHNTFALERGRVALNAELSAQGIPDTSVDNGWDGNFDTELEYANHINDPRLKIPANAYTSGLSQPPGSCDMFWYDRTPHVHPLYSISSDPDAASGLAPLAPVHYSRWPRAPGTLYVVRCTPPPES